LTQIPELKLINQKLLGIEIDYQLNFNAHVSSICRKASQQLNVLKRLGSLLNRLSKTCLDLLAFYLPGTTQ
jgi:hypothetical protein